MISVLFPLTSLVHAESQPNQSADSPMGMLVSAKWLSQHLHDPDLVVLDCTVKIELTEDGDMQAINGRASYNAGHIPGAGFADLMVDLSDTDKPIGYALPTPPDFF